MITTVDLLGAVCAHLAEFELPAIASVHVAASVPPPQVSVQLACHDLSGIAGGLLAWVETLEGVTAEVWRVPRSDSGASVGDRIVARWRHDPGLWQHAGHGLRFGC